MKKRAASFAFLCILFISSFAQDSVTTAINTSSAQTFSPKDVYKISWKVDAPVTGVGLGLSVLGLHDIQNKKDLTTAQLMNKRRDDIPAFDRGNAGFYSDKDNNTSYIPFYAGFATPVVMVLVNKNEREQAGKILAMYTETLAITATLYTLTAGNVNRSRPLVYPDKNGNYRAPESKRASKNSQRSFYAGHTAATATGSFFAAKVFSDLNPDSKFRPYMWAIAAALPAVTAYYRYESGEHFLSDNILGYVLGAGAGILVPQFHKTHKNLQHLTIAPTYEQGSKGIYLAYSF